MIPGFCRPGDLDGLAARDRGRGAAALAGATGDPVAWAQAVQARVDAVPVAPVTQNTAAEIVEFARQTRERGRAPPPIPRR